jgi:hypothetical protein
LCGPRPVHVVVARRAAGPVILPWRAPPVRELPMRYCKAHTTPCHPRQSLELVKLEGSAAMPQHGGPAPCHQGRAERLSGVSRLARAAAPPQPPPPAVQGRTQQRVSSPRSRAALGARAAPWARRGCRRVRWRLQGARSEALAHKCFWASYPSDHVWTLREVLLFRVPSWPQPQVC